MKYQLRSGRAKPSHGLKKIKQTTHVKGVFYANHNKRAVNEIIAKKVSDVGGRCIILDSTNLGTTSALVRNGIDSGDVTIVENKHSDEIKSVVEKLSLSTTVANDDVIAYMSSYPGRVRLLYLDFMGNTNNLAALTQNKNVLSKVSDDGVVAITYSCRIRIGKPCPKILYEPTIALLEEFGLHCVYQYGYRETQTMMTMIFVGKDHPEYGDETCFNLQLIGAERKDGSREVKWYGYPRVKKNPIMMSREEWTSYF